KINNKQPDSSGNYSLTGITDSQNISAFGRFDLEMEATFKNHSGSFSSWSFTLAPTGASGNANFDTTTGPYIFAAHLRGFNNLGATGETITSAWLAAGPRTPPVASVPLPSTLVLLAGAMAGLTGMGRGKKVFSRRR
ncbi:MAG: hypothetical protein OEV91_08700, partial [Desulfobulbaceae bacterium]|nr:hypothetical protein [Desulfobulbaceae bacterium]